MKMKTRNFGILPFIILLSLVLVFVGCAPKDPGIVTGGKHKVTFDLNYEGSTPIVQEVEDEDVAVEPETPVRTNYTFGGWFEDRACTQGREADFEYGITSDVTFYAKWTQTAFSVTLDPNYTGAEKSTVTASGTMTQPKTPERTGFLFTGWYRDAACTEEFDFSSSIDSDLTLYAGWEELEEDSSTVKVTFVYNYEGGGEYHTETVIKGGRVKKPADPTHAADPDWPQGYAFMSWCTDAACKESFSFNTFLNEATTLYAKWFKINTFEAEYTYLDEISGSGWSAEVGGVDVIDRDVYGAGASNGCYVTYLYRNGIELVFEIYAEEEVTDATLVLRLTAEGGQDVVITSDKYTVEVNGTALSYDNIMLSGVPAMGLNQMRAFTNHTVTAALHLNKGNNVVKLITSNSDSMGGTMSAIAPIVDCLYIYTNTHIDWAEGKCYRENLDKMGED